MLRAQSVTFADPFSFFQVGYLNPGREAGMVQPAGS